LLKKKKRGPKALAFPTEFRPAGWGAAGKGLGGEGGGGGSLARGGGGPVWRKARGGGGGPFSFPTPGGWFRKGRGGPGLGGGEKPRFFRGTFWAGFSKKAWDGPPAFQRGRGGGDGEFCFLGGGGGGPFWLAFGPKPTPPLQGGVVFSCGGPTGGGGRLSTPKKLLGQFYGPQEAGRAFARRPGGETPPTGATPGPPRPRGDGPGGVSLRGGGGARRAPPPQPHHGLFLTGFLGFFFGLGGHWGFPPGRGGPPHGGGPGGR